VHVTQMEQIVFPQCDEMSAKGLLQTFRKDRGIVTCEPAACLWENAIAHSWQRCVHVRIPHPHEAGLLLAHVRSRADSLLDLLQPPAFVCLIIAVGIALDRTVRQRDPPSLSVIKPMQTIGQDALLSRWL